MKHLVFTLLAALVFSGAASAQRLMVGVRGGVNFADYSFVPTRIGDTRFTPGSVRAGYDVGFVLRLNLSKHLHLQSELNYAFVNYNVLAENSGSRRITLRTERFEIPVQLGFQFGVLRLFGGERVQAAMERMNIDEDMPIESKMLTRSIQQAQTTVESRNFQARKSVLEYDDVMNKQREIIYGQRRQVLEGMDVKDVIMNMMNTSITHLVQNAFSGVQHLDMTSCQELLRQVEGLYFPKYAVRFSQEQLDAMDAQAVTDAFTQAAAAYYQQKEDEFTAPVMREVERVVLLRVVDEYWMEHIDAMSDLRQGIRLRAYAQTDPIIAYKKESLEMFEEMIAAIQDELERLSRERTEGMARRQGLDMGYLGKVIERMRADAEQDNK